MRKQTPERYRPLVNRAERGSMRAALALKCLDCSCWQVPEIKECAITHCPLYPYRPYQSRTGTDSEAVEVEEGDTVEMMPEVEERPSKDVA